MASTYSVSQVNAYIKNMFASDFVLANVAVKGEVSNCKYATSGHIYFSIKDKTSILNVVMFAGKRAGLSFDLADGQKVIVSGSVEVYEKGGNYQLYAYKIEHMGEGDLYQKFLQLKTELEEMGMFAPEYKKPIPAFTKSIGIATALTGAVIRDIENVVSRRNPYTKLFLIPCKVQGEGAARSIVEAIQILDTKDLDVLIVGRGGGSIEDLFAFNDIEVAKAIFDAKTPIISAVGHETDFTIADFVADLRAPTPSAAAELATFDVFAFEEEMVSYKNMYHKAMIHAIDANRKRVDRLFLRLEKKSPRMVLREWYLSVDKLQMAITNQMRVKLEETKSKIILSINRLKLSSPLERLAAGYAYAIIRDEKLTSVTQVKKGECVTLHVKDGCIQTQVTQIKGK